MLTKYVAKNNNYLENKEVFENFCKVKKIRYVYDRNFKEVRKKLKNGKFLKNETECCRLPANKFNNNKYSEEKEKIL